MAAAEDYALVRRQVGLLDRGDFGVLELTGRDRATFLHALVSNEIKALAPGQGCAATLLDVHGKVQVVLFVLVADDRIFVLTPPAMAAKTAEALRPLGVDTTQSHDDEPDATGFDVAHVFNLRTFGPSPATSWTCARDAGSSRRG